MKYDAIFECHICGLQVGQKIVDYYLNEIICGGTPNNTHVEVEMDNIGSAVEILYGA